jgi:hypothetical protein
VNVRDGYVQVVYLGVGVGAFVPSIKTVETSGISKLKASGSAALKHSRIVRSTVIPTGFQSVSPLLSGGS